MRGVPSKIEAKGDRIMVKLGSINMPLGNEQYRMLGLKKPRTDGEAVALAFKLNSMLNRVWQEQHGRRITTRRGFEIEFPNIRTPQDKKDKKEKKRSLEMNVEYSNIEMKAPEKDGETVKEPTQRQVEDACNTNGVVLKGYEWDDKREKLTIKFFVPRTRMEVVGQKETMAKINVILDKLNIVGAQKVTWSE